MSLVVHYLPIGSWIEIVLCWKLPNLKCFQIKGDSNVAPFDRVFEAMERKVSFRLELYR